MSKIIKLSVINRICLFCTAVFLLSSCGGSKIAMINIDAKAPSTFVHPSLQQFIKQNPGASVIVRDPNASIGAVSGSVQASYVCTLIEQALLMKGFNPRDRMLFENTLQKMTLGSDYVKIHEQTGTDLIFEVTRFAADPYVKSSYTDASGKEQPFLVKVNKKTTLPYNYVLWGFSIEIKVILLQDNLIAGLFRYYQAPCTDGCIVEYYDTNGMRYRTSLNQSVTAPEESREKAGNIPEKAVSDFISNVVIPSMFCEMGDCSAETSANAANRQASDSMNTAAPNLKNENSPKEAPQKKKKGLNILKFTESKQDNDAIINQTEKNSPPEIPSFQKNSYDLVKSVSDLISRSMEEQQSKLKANKRKEYKTDLEKLSNLTSAKQQEIANFINSITTTVNTPLVTENEIALFCKKTDINTDYGAIAFLDGKCVGVGSFKKGLFTSLPKDEYGKDIQTLTIYSCGSSFSNMFKSPINFSLKNYYQFEYNKMKYVLSN